MRISILRKLTLFMVLFLITLTSVYALPLEDVKLTNYVNDYTNTLSAQEIQSISSITRSLYENDVAQVAVVIVDNFDDLSKEEYAIGITHDQLGDTVKDNGLLILVGLEVREYRIEVGYGLEGVLNDAKVGRLSRELLVPLFQKGEYGQGIALLVQGIGFELMPQGIPAPTQPPTNSRSTGMGSWFVFMIVFFIFRAISYSQYKKKHNKDPKNKDVNDALGAAFIASMFLRPPRGGFGGGGMNGGFGGFGGGGFGGGGAGGGW